MYLGWLIKSNQILNPKPFLWLVIKLCQLEEVLLDTCRLRFF